MTAQAPAINRIPDAMIVSMPVHSRVKRLLEFQKYLA